MSETVAACRVCGEVKAVGCYAPSEIKRFRAAEGRRRPRCNVCGAARFKRYYADNRQQVTSRTKARREANPPHRVPSGAVINCAVCGAVFQRTNAALSCSEECALQLQRERYRRKNRQRRLLQGSPGLYSLAEIASRDDYTCHLCSKGVDMTKSGMHPWGPTIDHLVPVSAHGADVESNVALAHRTCNVRRGSTGPAQLRLI